MRVGEARALQRGLRRGEGSGPRAVVLRIPARENPPAASAASPAL